MAKLLDFSPRVKDCILEAIVGKRLGGGCFRQVFALDDDRVLKVEDDASGSFSNVSEWKIWNDVQWTKWARWFAPCIQIDPFGTALIQARTLPLSDREWAKVTQVPNFFTDLKRENWGMLKGKPVCHDYGNNLFVSRGLSGARLVKNR